MPIESEATELVLVQKDSNWGRVQNFKLYLGIEPVNTRVLAISD